MNGCRLCLSFEQRDSIDIWNQPIIESANFLVLPSLGALVEGWLLLVPKKHFLCMGALPKTMVVEMQRMKELLVSTLQPLYGSVCAFEHGPSRPKCKVGCGVDHAHLHLVPVSFNVASAAREFLPEGVSWFEAGIAECQDAFERGEDYLYLEQPIGVGRITMHPSFGSQVFRRAIANQLGAGDRFNWREDAQLPNLLATLKRLREQGGITFSCKIGPEVAA